MGIVEQADVHVYDEWVANLDSESAPVVEEILRRGGSRSAAVEVFAEHGLEPDSVGDYPEADMMKAARHFANKQQEQSTKLDGQLCDFCNREDDIAAVWHTEPFQVDLPQAMTPTYAKPWAACSSCDAAIQADDRDALKLISFEARDQRFRDLGFTDEELGHVHRELNGLHDAFWAHKTRREPVYRWRATVPAALLGAQNVSVGVGDDHGGQTTGVIMNPDTGNVVGVLPDTPADKLGVEAVAEHMGVEVEPPPKMWLNADEADVQIPWHYHDGLLDLRVPNGEVGEKVVASMTETAEALDSGMTYLSEDGDAAVWRVSGRLAGLVHERYVEAQRGAAYTTEYEVFTRKVA